MDEIGRPVFEIDAEDEPRRAGRLGKRDPDIGRVDVPVAIAAGAEIDRQRVARAAPI
ncbi:MAG: hypothetical protein LC634_01375 [Sphingomonadales bacterium]|nr:hypothetical protein [Sphingomonadales bacterium]